MKPPPSAATQAGRELFCPAFLKAISLGARAGAERLRGDEPFLFPHHLLSSWCGVRCSRSLTTLSAASPECTRGSPLPVSARLSDKACSAGPALRRVRRAAARFAALSCTVVACTIAPISAAVGMQFQISGRTVMATGDIVAGDATRFWAFIRQQGIADDEDDVTIRLSSGGGSVLEGIALGTAFREARVETMVPRGDQCASACALAFLGGTRRLATGVDVGRRLEFGATLGFHGFRVAAEAVRLENETLDISRVLSGLILEYAARMGAIDLGWIARSLTVPPGDLLIVRMPADVQALRITLDGLPRAMPADWHVNVCRLAIAGMNPVLDGWGERVVGTGQPIPTIRALRNAIVWGRFPNGPVARFAEGLSDGTAIDLALGSDFNLDRRRPILDVRTVPLERGAGFYFDRCVAVRSGTDITAILIDDVSNRLHRRDFSGQEARLAVFNPRADLW